MNDYEYIQRLKLLGGGIHTFGADMSNIERLKQYNIIEAVSKINGIHIDNAVQFVMNNELFYMNIDSFVKNMKIACKLFGNDAVTKMLSAEHKDNLYLTYDYNQYGKIQTFGKNCRITFDNYKCIYSIKFKDSIINNIYAVDINSRADIIGLRRIHGALDRDNAEVHMNDDGFIKSIETSIVAEYADKYNIRDTLSIRLQ